MLIYCLYYLCNEKNQVNESKLLFKSLMSFPPYISMKINKYIQATIKFIKIIICNAENCSVLAFKCNLQVESLNLYIKKFLKAPYHSKQRGKS